MKKKSTPLQDMIGSIKTNTIGVLALAVILIVAAFIYVPTVQEELGARPSEAGGITYGGDPSDSSIPDIGGPIEDAIPDDGDTPWGTGPSDVDPNSGIESLIANNGRSPKIHANKIVYTVTKLWDTHGHYTGDIYMKDLETDETIPISTTPGKQCYPDIYNNYIVWVNVVSDHYSNRLSDIHMFDLTTQIETNITTNDVGVESMIPAIHSNKIVWIDRMWPQEPMTTRIMIHDIETGITNNLSPNTKSPWSPDIFEDTVVWEQTRTWWSTSKIWIKDLISGNERYLLNNISALGENLSTPKIYNPWVIWADYRHNENHLEKHAEIYAYNIEQTFPMVLPTRLTYYTDSGGTAFGPAIYGTTITWHGNELDTYYPTFDIWSKEILDSDNDKTRLTIAKNKQFHPDIFTNKVVWEDHRNGYSSPSIYMFEMWQ